jgi:hypothetical protein
VNGQSIAFGQIIACKDKYNPIKIKPIPLQKGAVFGVHQDKDIILNQTTTISILKIIAKYFIFIFYII